MPDMLLETMLTITVLIGWFGITQLILNVRQTALVAAAYWASWAQLTLTIAAVVTILRHQFNPGILDLFWYLAAVSALCPFVAVLGARRNRALDWSLFVLLPLLVVLQWPALAQWRRCWNGQRLELETPTLIGFLLVLVMGASNFIGTRFTRPAIVWIATWGLIAWSFKETGGSNRFPSESVYSFVAISLLVFWTAVAKAAMRRSPATGMDKVWRDFRNSFGTVWAFRLMTRINEIAQRDQWPWRLTHEGLRLTSIGSPYAGDPADDMRVDQTFRWLLKQFVETVWLDRRLGRSSLEPSPSQMSGSLLRSNSPTVTPVNDAGEATSSQPQSPDHDALH